MKNFNHLKKKEVLSQYIKIFEQNSVETKELYELLNPCIIMEVGEISLDQLFKNKEKIWDFERVFSIYMDLRRKIK